MPNHINPLFLTNMETPICLVVRCYNKRGVAEQ
jgi:hypothetical protein